MRKGKIDTPDKLNLARLEEFFGGTKKPHPAIPDEAHCRVSL
jgi:hypothetical protein